MRAFCRLLRTVESWGVRTHDISWHRLFLHFYRLPIFLHATDDICLNIPHIMPFQFPGADWICRVLRPRGCETALLTVSTLHCIQCFLLYSDGDDPLHWYIASYRVPFAAFIPRLLLRTVRARLSKIFFCVPLSYYRLSSSCFLKYGLRAVGISNKLDVCFLDVSCVALELLLGSRIDTPSWVPLMLCRCYISSSKVQKLFLQMSDSFAQ